MKKIAAVIGFFLLFLFVTPVSAHEAYVLTRQEFLTGLAVNTPNPLGPLLDTSHLGITALITVCVGLSFFFVIFWAATPWASYLDKLIKKTKIIGPLIIRIAISASFFFAAASNCVLGPELSLSPVTGNVFILTVLFAISLMIFFGVFIEVAALIGLIIFFYITNYYGVYMITYANYFGELIVLLLFGSRFLSVDRMLFGKKLWFAKLEKYKTLEVPIVRILYGVALIYAGWTIKFQHQGLSIEVYNQYHLKDFFHASAAFIAAGAGLSEISIGIFILLGFAMRFTVLISLFFITLSLLYFHELIWPHIMLYGISFSLLINSGDVFTIDHYVPFW
ncbi:MAG: DoxX family membrane protein, partial [Candidatus Levyibacteriota bacterium]